MDELMKTEVTLALFFILLTSPVGCDAETSTVSSGPFHVDGKTGRATGRALGITFEVSGATGVETKNLLKAGEPEQNTAQTEITLADDVLIHLEMLEGGSPISFQLNGNDFGALKEGDNVVIDEKRNVTVNRTPRRTPARLTAQHVAHFTHRSPDGGSGGVTTARFEGQPFYGFDETNFSSSTLMIGAETEVNFQFRLVDSRGGRDIYEITRTIIKKQERNNLVTTKSKGGPMTITVEYAGEELVAFDDEYGVAKLKPAPKAESNQ